MVSDIGRIIIGFISICIAFCVLAQFIEWCCYKKSDFWEKRINEWKNRQKKKENQENMEADFTDIRGQKMNSERSNEFD